MTTARGIAILMLLLAGLLCGCASAPPEHFYTLPSGARLRALAPGEAFEYTSFCPLTTPVGSMHGSYLMTLANGERFEAEIAVFSLSVPNAVN